jgi:hypothetical protein
MDSHPLAGALDRWERVVDDMAGVAAEYRERGWETVELHTGDVTALRPGDIDDEPEQYGFDVLVPGSEYETVESLVEGSEFGESEAYRAEEGDLTFVLLVMKAPAEKRAVLIPLYYERSEAAATIERAREADEMRVFVRPLSDDRRVTFAQRGLDGFVAE